MTQTAIYPTWQTAIRAAQLEQEAQERQREAEQAEQERQSDLKWAGQLQQALAFFGITAAPTSNSYDLDGFQFSLREGYEIRQQSVRFRMEVSYILPERYRSEAEFGDYHTGTWDEIAINWKRPGDIHAQAELANALDRITQNAQAFMAQVDERAQRSTSPVSVIAPPTLAEQLELLIRQIVREELSEA